MAWTGSLTASSTDGSYITYIPDIYANRGYTVTTFTAPKKGVYQFGLRGSGGSIDPHGDGVTGTGGAGGYTVGNISMEANQTVYIGAGGPLSAAFVSSVYGANLASIPYYNVYFVAGGGGGGGSSWGKYGKYGGNGGAGGGTTGAAGVTMNTAGGGGGGTQTGGAAYGTGVDGNYGNNNDTSSRGGNGGDGWWGGGAGGSMGDAGAGGGGGGSGYINVAGITVGSKYYANSTTQGGGAASNSNGYVSVTYVGPAELPIKFNGTAITDLYYNGMKITSLIYNGTKIFMRRLRDCLSLTEPAFC